MNAERNDPSVWKELSERGKQLAADVDIEPMIRTSATQSKYPSRKARDVLAKNHVFFFGRSPRTRTK